MKVPTCSRHKCPTPHPPRLGGSTQDTVSIFHRYASRSTHHADCDLTRAACCTLAAMGDKGTERAPISRRQPFGCPSYLARIGKTTSREPSLGFNETAKTTEKDWYLSFQLRRRESCPTGVTAVMYRERVSHGQLERDPSRGRDNLGNFSRACAPHCK